MGKDEVTPKSYLLRKQRQFYDNLEGIVGAKNENLQQHVAW